MADIELMTTIDNVNAVARRYDKACAECERLIAEGVDEETATRQSGYETASDALMDLAAAAYNGDHLRTALYAVRCVSESRLPVSDAMLERMADRYGARGA